MGLLFFACLICIFERIEYRHGLAERQPRQIEFDGERSDGRRRPLPIPSVSIFRLERLTEQLAEWHESPLH